MSAGGAIAMNVPSLKDFEEKCRRVRAYLDESGYDALIIGRRDNFAWFTFGGDNKIFRSSDIGFGLLVVTREKVTLVAQYMDAARIMDDELGGLPIEAEVLKWFELSREEAALRIAKGRAAADYPIGGADCRFEDVLALHTPYTEWEVERYAQVGRLNDALYLEVANGIKPGMTEQQAEALLMGVFGREAMIPKVLLVGSDERIGKYRHPNASNKKIEKLLLLHAAADKFGLHANITRMVYFGDALPPELERRYELLNRCQASAFSMLTPGALHSRILEARKKLLAEEGMEHEFELHYPGMTTGYFVGSGAPFAEDTPVVDTTCYDLFITVTGAKVEELSMARPGGAKVLSTGGGWPLKRYAAGGYSCELPVILMR